MGAVVDGIVGRQQGVRSLIATKTIQEVTQVSADLRFSERYPTLEFRVAYMCMTVDESVMIAGLTRGLARNFYEGGCS
ncbi:hypothetical protein NDI49_26865 [Trichocoleus sp. ST-U3]